MNENKAMLPLNIRVKKAKVELTYAVNVICEKYGLDGVIDAVIESVLAQEYREQLAQICNQLEPEMVEVVPDNKDVKEE